jgi:hypothetical protein
MEVLHGKNTILKKIKLKLMVFILFVCISLVWTPSYAQKTTTIDLGGRTITSISTFNGFQSLVDRDYTGGESAYDYSVHLIKTGEETGSRHRAFIGGRWKSNLGDGDHVLQWTSENGLANTWAMWSQAPEFLQGQEEGKSGTWFARNVLEPEVMLAADNKWIMLTQVMIQPGDPIDISGQIAITQADRIMLLTSADCKNWTRKEDRGVIVNVATPTITNFHHQEIVYVPWDPDGKVYWMYVAYDVNGVFQGYIRIRSNDYSTFDFNSRETVSGMVQLGNQIGYLENAPGGNLFVRITFITSGTRTVPALQYSSNGINWSAAMNELEGSSDNVNNKNCYFLGIATINGRGAIPYSGNNQWNTIYAATTSNSPVAPEIYFSEIGMGTLTINITQQAPTFTYDVTADNIISGFSPETTKNLFLQGINNPNGVVRLFYPDGSELANSAVVGTNISVVLYNGTESATYKTMLHGDIDGDGYINVADLIVMRQFIIKSSSLSGLYLAASDVNTDGRTSISDLVALKKHILGMDYIIQ